jgi:formylglycine-generating enzyme required for sulfatase activity
MTIRLPTEAQWEYACRAGSTTPFSFGPTISTDQANYNGDYAFGDGKKGANRKKTLPVGSFPPNAWGLYDMHGNVYEWCRDLYGPYPSEAQVDPVGPPSGNGRVLRGGSWAALPSYCRSTDRMGPRPVDRSDNFGFRIVAVPTTTTNPP